MIADISIYILGSTGVVLVVLMLLYFKLATRYSIIDKPNDRSSHITPTIRGGGIIFPVSVTMFGVFSCFEYAYLIVAVSFLAIVSFLDDIKDLPRSIRFGVHLLATALILIGSGAVSLPIVLVACAVVYVVGTLNAFNFMDGINGITGFYSLAALLPLYIVTDSLVSQQLIVFVVLAVLIFLFFNSRTKARCFAGDVGSLSIAAIVCYLLVQHFVQTEDYSFLAFISLYLVDTGCTIIQRLYSGEKIFEAHRKHLFQVLSNELRINHLVVATIYGLCQLAINMLLINTNYGLAGVIMLFICQLVIYVIIKVSVLKYVKGKRLV